MTRFPVLAAAVLLLAGCAALPPAPVPVRDPLASHLGRADEIGACARYLLALDRRVEELGVADVQAARVPGFPYVRVDRFLAALSQEVDPEGPAFEVWLGRALALDGAGRRIEIANAGAGLRLEVEGAAVPVAREHVTRCRTALAEADRAVPAARRRLLGRARVPPRYSVAKRVLGLYPMAAVPFSWGIDRWHASVREVFAMPLASLPRRGRPQRFVPPAAPDAAPPRRPRADALGVPAYAPEDLEALFARHAPVWEIDVASDADRPGALRWRAGRLEVDPQELIVYRHVSHALFEGRVLLQLNYVVWFSARPPAGSFDLLAGHLDGLTWRVTLDRDGAPLAFDTMHNCGCFYLFFPGPRLVPRERARVWEEPILVPEALGPEAIAPDRRIVVRLAARTHYVDRVYPAARRVAGSAYRLRPYAELRSLPRAAGAGRRSAFAPDGLVPGTARAERWLFWPMGVASPGAMRQWGHHAVAFVGRRHFDDPRLIERHFARRPLALSPPPAPLER